MKAKRLGIFPNLSKEKVQIALPEFVEMCRDWGLEPLLPEDVAGEFGCGGFDKKHITYMHNDFLQSLDAAVSLGGDGTFLRTAEKVARCGIPILGINTGHLGYLADASVENIDEVVENLFSGNYKIEERTVLHVTTDSGVVIDNPFALNEIAISRQSTALMMSMHTWVNGSDLTTYKGDGLIISTPTGSTAYNLSVGGPILEPTSNNIVLSPISAHSLTMRPLVLRDDCTIRVTTNSRAQQYLVSIDGRPFTFDIGTSITVRKADFTVKVIQHTGHNFADTLRNKLMWGIDTVRSY